ncbi:MULTISPECIES: heavy metal-binding domain-containing protein [unclassified Flavobacterium]|jgi:Cu2+-exporting ATPase|uniref:heavy metal-binding domain-containing protein n=1 Tax=unclassified Flavobacterium TaxID=196869 RepID=UPI0025BA2426|nr:MULTISPECIES: heavy metal-binding domain-containing protein [unclassified Flavobacterium]
MNKSNEVFAGSDQKSENHSCCGGNSHQHLEVSNVDSGKEYQCPMKCEGEKTYKAPGNCPVCNMHLAPIK